MGRTVVEPFITMLPAAANVTTQKIEKAIVNTKLIFSYFFTSHYYELKLIFIC